MKIRGQDAVTIAEVLPTAALYYYENLGGNKQIDAETGARYVAQGAQGAVWIDLPDTRVTALCDRIRSYQTAYDQTEAQLGKLEERVLADRAKFVRSAAAHMMPATNGSAPPAERACEAVELALALDAEIYERMRAEEEEG